MLSTRIGKRAFFASSGEITTDSYSTTIKNLALVQQKTFAQLVPLRFIAGQMHIWAALEQSLDAFESGTNFTKKLELEFLCRLLAEKQLNRALAKARFGKEPVALIIESAGKKELSAVKKALNFRDKEIALGSRKKDLMKFFGVSEEELSAMKDSKSALEDLVVERVAMVALER